MKKILSFFLVIAAAVCLATVTAFAETDDGARVATPVTAASITATGYYDGYRIAPDAAIFTYDPVMIALGQSTDDKAWGTAKLSDILDSEKTVARYVVEHNQIVAMVIDETIARGDSLYGVYLDQAEIKDGDYRYEITMLVDGKEVGYKAEKNVDALGGAFTTDALYEYKLDTEGALDSGTVSDVKYRAAIGSMVGSAEGISAENDAIEGVTPTYGTEPVTVSYDENVIVYTWDKVDSEYKVGTIDDVTDADAGTMVRFYSTIKDSDDDDGVARLILVDTEVRDSTQKTVDLAAATAPADTIWTSKAYCGSEGEAAEIAVTQAKQNASAYSGIDITGTATKGSTRDYTSYTVTLTYSHTQLDVTAQTRTVTVAIYADPAIGEATWKSDDGKTWLISVDKVDSWTVSAAAISAVTMENFPDGTTVTAERASGTALRLTFSNAPTSGTNGVVTLPAGLICGEYGNESAEAAVTLYTTGVDLTFTVLYRCNEESRGEGERWNEQYPAKLDVEITLSAPLGRTGTLYFDPGTVESDGYDSDRAVGIQITSAEKNNTEFSGRFEVDNDSEIFTCLKFVDSLGNVTGPTARQRPKYGTSWRD